MEKFKLNIQLFGGAGEPDESKGATATLQDILGNEELMKQIIGSDAIKALIQSETDKVRTKAAQEKQAKISEFAQYKEQTDKTIAELKAFQTEFLKTEVLKTSGLDVELWGYVKGETKEEIQASAKALKDLIGTKAQQLAGAPAGKGGTSGPAKPVTAEQFGKMTYSEKAELYQTDPELYRKLIRGE